MKEKYIFLVAETEKKLPEALIFHSCRNIKWALLWLIKWYTILEDFILLDSVRYYDDVMTTLKSNWSNLKILMSV